MIIIQYLFKKSLSSLYAIRSETVVKKMREVSVTKISFAHSVDLFGLKYMATYAGQFL